MLASLGFADHNGDGVVEDRAGHPVEFALLTSANNNVGVAMCNILVDDLKQVGIKVNLSPVEFNSLVTRLDNTFNWEAVMLGSRRTGATHRQIHLVHSRLAAPLESRQNETGDTLGGGDRPDLLRRGQNSGYREAQAL